MLLTVDGIAVDDDNHDADTASMTIIRYVCTVLTGTYSIYSYCTDTVQRGPNRNTGIVYHKYPARCKYYEYTGIAYMYSYVSALCPAIPPQVYTGTDSRFRYTVLVQYLYL